MTAYKDFSQDTKDKMEADRILAQDKNIKCHKCGKDCISTYMGKKTCAECMDKAAVQIKPKVLNLKNTTLVIIDSVNPSRANDVLRKCLAVANFRAVFAKSFSFINSIEKYSEYILRDLHKEIDTDFALIIQWDGFIVNPEAWDPDFMNYDYIGAPWWYENQHNVGNGGFSLRSKKLLEATAKMDVINFHPEDDVIRQNAELLKTEYGIRFAPEELAAKFSWEENGKYPNYNGSFGFHGASNVNKFLK